MTPDQDDAVRSPATIGLGWSPGDHLDPIDHTPAPSIRLDPGPAIPPPAPVGVRVGAWRLMEALGPGTFAAVDTTTGADVVVKVAEPTPAAAARTRREAAAHRAVGGGDHPALVATAGSHDDGRTVAVASHRVPGVPLDQVAAEHPLPPTVVAGLLAPIADALAWMHARGWVHGDVSAANIVVGPGGAVLVDLGAARPSDSTQDHPAEVTPASAAPEVLAGQPPSSGSDVWSLAAVARHVATGADAGAGIRLAAALAPALDPARGRRPPAAELAIALAALAGHPAGDPAARRAGVALPRTGTTRRAARATVDLGLLPQPADPPPPRFPAWPLAAAGAVAAVAAAVAGWVGG